MEVMNIGELLPILPGLMEEIQQIVHPLLEQLLQKSKRWDKHQVVENNLNKFFKLANLFQAPLK